MHDQTKTLAERPKATGKALAKKGVSLAASEHQRQVETNQRQVGEHLKRSETTEKPHILKTIRPVELESWKFNK